MHISIAHQLAVNTPRLIFTPEQAIFSAVAHVDLGGLSFAHQQQFVPGVRTRDPAITQNTTAVRKCGQGRELSCLQTVQLAQESDSSEPSAQLMYPLQSRERLTHLLLSLHIARCGSLQLSHADGNSSLESSQMSLPSQRYFSTLMHESTILIGQRKRFFARQLSQMEGKL